MNDLRYINEDNIKALNTKIEENGDLAFQLESANKTVFTREH